MKHLRSIALASVSALVVTALAACGSGGGGSDVDEIVVGASGPETGQYTELGLLLDGAEARFKELNDAGGIDGVQVRFVRKDDQYNPSQTLQQTRQLVEDEGASMICGTVGTTPYASVNEYLGSKGILGVPASGSESLLNDHTFQVLAPYGPLGERLVHYAVDELGTTNIAIAYSADDVGQPFHEGATKAIQEKGLNFVAEVPFDATATDFSVQAAQLKDSGADIVLVNHVATVSTRLQNAAVGIGYEPNWGETFVAASPDLLELAPQAAAKTYFATPFLLPEAPEASAFQDAMEKFAPNVNTEGVYPIEGYSIADGCIEVLKRAVEDADGEVPTAEQILAAAQAMAEEEVMISTNYVRDLIWTQDDHSGQKVSQITEVEDGTFVSVDDFAGPGE